MNAKRPKTAIQPTREENYPEWYQEVIKAAELASHSSVRGCMIIRPWGFRLWEQMQKHLDAEFKRRGVENAYFPLFVPVSNLEKEAQHVSGFAKECAVITHHRLESQDGKLVPAGPLAEPLVVRPTSEMIIGEYFSETICSYRDLPMRINQWANVVRWEMRTRMFLRTMEFLWQEGHTAFATQEEAEANAQEMIGVYADFVKNILAIPVIIGEKTEVERFPGAVSTLAIEAMMQDGKALQCGTSHHLGQNFARASQITFDDESGVQQYAYTASWGMTTRLIGAVIMVHSDDDGLIIPPRLAQIHVVIIPFIMKDADPEAVIAKCRAMKEELEKLTYHGQPVGVLIDERELSASEKKWEWVKKGVSFRIEVGARDIDKGTYPLTCRCDNAKVIMPEEEIFETLLDKLDAMQDAMFTRALHERNHHTRECFDRESFYSFFEEEKGFVIAPYAESCETEEKIAEDLSVTARIILTDRHDEAKCFYTGESTTTWAIFAKSY